MEADHTRFAERSVDALEGLSLQCVARHPAMDL